MKTELTAEYVREALDYNPDTGVFTWKERPIHHFNSKKAQTIWNIRFSKKKAGNPDGKGYSQLGLKRKNQYFHRLAWLYSYGKHPPSQIDHINGDRMDNRLCNLREASQTQNLRNSKRRVDNTSGIKGVHFDKKNKRWMAYVNVNGLRIWLGYHGTAAEAELAVRSEREKQHQEFTCHGERDFC